MLLGCAVSAGADLVSAPHGQLTAAAVVADSSGNKILFCSPGNGYWMTLDRGQSWEHINDKIINSELLYSGAHGYAVSIDPAADTLIINAQQVSPNLPLREFHSYDGGETWSSYNIDVFWPDSLLLIHGWGDYIGITRSEPSRTFYSKTSGFGISYGGDVWNIIDISNYSQGIEGMYHRQTDVDTIYLYGTFGKNGNNQGGILVSYDGGISWGRLVPMQDLVPGHGGIHGLVKIGPSTLMALLESYELEQHPDFIRSDDNGETWYTVAGEGFPETMGWKTDLCAIEEVPGKLLVGGRDFMGLWESDDYGETWNRVLRGLPINGMPVFRIYRNEYSGHLYVCLQGQGVYQSTDLGMSWQLIPGPPCGVVGNDWQGTLAFTGGVMRSSESGELWVARGTSTTFEPLDTPVFEDSHCYVQTCSYENDDIIYSHKRGLFWENGNGEREQRLQIRVQAQSGEDREITPELVSITVPAHVIMKDNGEDTLYIATNVVQDRIYTYNSGSIEWIEKELGFIGYYILEHDNKLYSYADTGSEWKIAVSSNYGDDWQYMELPVPLNNGFQDIQAKMLFDTNDIYVRIEENVWVYDGEYWEQRGQIAGDISSVVRLNWEIINLENNIILFAGTVLSRNLWVSYDAGWTWESQAIELPDPFLAETTWQLEYDPWRDRLWLDTGVGLAYLDDPTSSVGEDVWVFQPANYVTLDAYPNPFNASTTVRYTVTRPGDVKVTVFDLLGRRVAELYDGVARPGEHTVSFDGSGLSSGTYFLHLDTPERTLNRKLTLVK